MTEEISSTQDFIYNLTAAAGFGSPSGGVCFAARNAGLFRSDDGGQTWTDATLSLQLSEPVAATAVAMPTDFERNHVILAGMAGGVLRSVDGGHTWQIPTLPPPPPMVTALVLSPNFTVDGIVFAGTMEDGVINSTDSGFSWASWNFGLLDLSVLCLAVSPAFSSDETIFAGTETGIFRSTNGGRAWREIDLPIGYEPVISLALSQDYASDQTIYAGTESQGILVSADGGDSWTRLGDSFAGEPVNNIYFMSDGKKHAGIAVLSNGLAWSSRDGGASWTQLWAKLAEEGKEISTLLAPQGFGKGKTAWLGLFGGDVIQVKFE